MQPLDLRNAEDLTELSAAIASLDLDGGLLIIDTLNRAAMGADENSAVDMGDIIAACKALQTQTRGMVMLIHHTGKDLSKGLRGHSSLFAALDAAIEVTRNDDRREWRVAKSKDDEDGMPRPFRLEAVEVGTDDEGMPVSSCVVLPDAPGASVKSGKLPQGPTQKIVYDVVGELLRVSPDTCKAGAPPLRPCIELETAVLKAADRLSCRSDQRPYQARRAINAMVSKGVLCLREDWIWRPS
jgi:hypothetical protein